MLCLMLACASICARHRFVFSRPRPRFFSVPSRACQRVQGLERVLWQLYQSWSDWGKQISDEYGWWLIGGGVALFLLICIGCIVLTGGDDDDGRGQKKSS